MNTKAQYFPKEKLHLKPVVDGARMWALPWKRPCLLISRLNQTVIFSKLFGFIPRSDRRACIMQIRENGITEHTEKMAFLQRRTIGPHREK